eukprot:scaffold37576_cov19-Tisochrysis_lutea.AAC.3
MPKAPVLASARRNCKKRNPLHGKPCRLQVCSGFHIRDARKQQHLFIAAAKMQHVSTCPCSARAGNIRLEEGRQSDLWYASCVDLVNSRFQPNDYDSSLKVA